MGIEFAIPSPEFGSAGAGRPKRNGPPLPTPGRCAPLAAGLRPALDSRASAAHRPGLIGQAGGLPLAAHARPTPAALRAGNFAQPDGRDSLTNPLPGNASRHLPCRRQR